MHLAGIGVGGMAAQVAALEHPDAFSALTLVDRAVAPGPVDADLPDHGKATITRLFTPRVPEWTDREGVAEFAAAGAEIVGDYTAAARHDNQAINAMIERAERRSRPGSGR